MRGAFVHRDLKPANVMIGSFGEVQVVDWGMGKVLRRETAEQADASKEDAHTKDVPQPVETLRSKDSSSQSLVGSVMGTPAYMPPSRLVAISRPWTRRATYSPWVPSSARS
jgi:serine/threonine protein kinase